jgi:spore maturation protein CgeB
MTPVRLLYIGLKYDYGDPARGFSYEQVNFFGTLSRMEGFEVRFFPFDEEMRREGRDGMNRSLLRVVDEYRPEVCFFVLFTDEIAKRTIRRISETSGSVTLNWFGDDHWRFLPFSRHWAPLFHWAVTTDSRALDRYHACGCANVMHSQWAFNHHRVVRQDVPVEYDVTFIGQVHSRRRSLIALTKKAGVPVECWGRGWRNGRLGQEEMIAMYSRSRINLNFTDSSAALGWKPLAKILFNRRADDSILVNSPVCMFEQARVLLAARAPQIKARNFEVPGAGGFLLTSAAGDLAEYFVPGEEIAVFGSDRELLDSIRYYLAHEKEREGIREAGYRRARRDHTYEQRFQAIFTAAGVMPRPARSGAA